MMGEIVGGKKENKRTMTGMYRMPSHHHPQQRDEFYEIN